jgi:hypothetical protein
MFKWICLAVAVIFLSVLAWMLNDMRLELRRSSEMLHTTGKTINEHLPAIVDKTRKTTDSLAEHLPEIAQKLRTTTTTVAELTEDIRQLRELVGLASGQKRDDGLVAYANSVLGTLEMSGGVIGLKKLSGRGLKNPVPAKEWVVGARREALVLSFLVRSKTEMLTRLGKNKFGFNWYLQVADGEPVTLIDWLKANHPPTQELQKSGARAAALLTVAQGEPGTTSLDGAQTPAFGGAGKADGFPALARIIRKARVAAPAPAALHFIPPERTGRGWPGW